MGDMRRVRTLVVGGGPAGLAVAYALQGDTLVVERNDSVGGLCRSIEHELGVFDVGGHSFHTPHPEVRALIDGLLEDGLHVQKRDARVYTHGTMIPYPFQQHFRGIPRPDVVRECEDGLARVEPGAAARAENFEEYLVAKFGEGIAKHFLLPYNRKLWGRDLRTMSSEWTSERIAASGDGERFDTGGGVRKPLQPDTEVAYPTSGGFQEIYRSFVPHLPEVRLGREIVAIDPAARTARTRDGETYGWEVLVSTVPLPLLARMTEGVPEPVRAAADALEYMSLRVELLLIGRRLSSEIQRIYCAEPGVPHKIALNHNSSPSLRGRRQHAIMAEVSVPPGGAHDAGRAADAAVDLLLETGVLDHRNDVVWRDHLDVEYAYPVYTHDRPVHVGRVKAWFEERGIHTVGRFGDWEYVNSDRCVWSGLELGRRLAGR